MIWDLEDLEIKQGTPEKIPFKANRVDGVSPAVGLTFADGEIRVGILHVEVAGFGAVTEVGGGWYYYMPLAGETLTQGPISIRTNRSDLFTFVTTALIVAPAAIALPGAGAVAYPTLGFKNNWLSL